MMYIRDLAAIAGLALVAAGCVANLAQEVIEGQLPQSVEAHSHYVVAYLSRSAKAA